VVPGAIAAGWKSVSAVPYWRLYYHAEWATKNRESVIDDGMIVPIVQAIEQTARDPGVTVFAVGVMPEHVHVFAQIPPSLSVANIIGRWKGASSHAANEHRPNTLAKLAWQSGYGVLSVSQSGFDQVLAYVQNQHERHANRTLYGVLERTGDDTSCARADKPSIVSALLEPR
jgi:REP element-mobilizing transposase RayT